MGRVSHWRRRCGVGFVSGAGAVLIVVLCSQGIPWTLSATARAADEDAVWQPHRYRMYGFGVSQNFPALDELLAMDVNFVYAASGMVRRELTGTSSEADLDRQWRAYAQRVHAAGGKLARGTPLVSMRFDLSEGSPEEFLAHCVRDAQGRPYPNRETRGRLDLWRCLNQEYWLAPFVETVMTDHVQRGCDVSHIDLAKAATCYCPTCREKWDTWCAARWPEPISLDEAVRNSDPGVQALHNTFRYACVVEFLRKAKRQLREVRPDYAFDTTNHMHDRSMWFWVYGRDVFDIACIELTTYEPGWFPPVGESLSSYRLAFACMGSGHAIWAIDKMLIQSESAVDPGVTMEDASTAGQWVGANPGERWQRLNPSADRQRLYLAQALMEGAMANPPTLADHHAEAWGTRPILYHDITRRYYAFHREHAKAFRRSESMAQVVVLVSVADMVLDRTASKGAFYGLCQTLHKAQIPFDVRTLEHTDEVDWAKYRVVLLPAARCLGDDALTALEEVAGQGKHVLRFGPIAERTDQFVPRAPADAKRLAPISRCDVDPASLIRPFHQPAPDDAASELIARLTPWIDSTVTLHHAEKAYLVAQPVENEEAILLHLLNYHIPTYPELPEREQLAAERAIPADNVEVVLALPAGFEVAAVESRSPDHEPVDLDFHVSDGAVRLTVPRIATWEMVRIARK